ncbi:hypothetical protein K2173_000858 [Erythroxylum novogranatense]|uniref:Uncharacterized protein n=1 Tax=Erythroxylum novogranatense TaxID=1862640 RepID=A0AAV8S7W6_9ROSI|nr:hypothetical protein K2173_000858 [Erythroxylum novogranatense]
MDDTSCPKLDSTELKQEVQHQREVEKTFVRVKIRENVGKVKNEDLPHDFCPNLYGNNHPHKEAENQASEEENTAPPEEEAKEPEDEEKQIQPSMTISDEDACEGRSFHNLQSPMSQYTLGVLLDKEPLSCSPLMTPSKSKSEENEFFDELEELTTQAL